jgi:LPS-assembly protein
VVQRYLLRDQQVTPDGVPFTSASPTSCCWAGQPGRGAGRSTPRCSTAPTSQRRCAPCWARALEPGPFRTLSTTYRLTRGLSEQVELGWQWPIWKSALAASNAAVAGGPAAARLRRHLVRVGRVNYSMKDSRVTDSMLGLEYDAGCWIMRVVAERLSTGRSEATTRLLLQLELVGLSRLGSNPLKVLKDNIPGYRLLRDERSDPPDSPPPRYE